MDIKCVAPRNTQRTNLIFNEPIMGDNVVVAQNNAYKDAALNI